MQNRVNSNEPLNDNTYVIIGYDKDNDVYEEYGKGTNFEEVTEKAKELSKLVRKDELRRENGEPIDWIVVYKNYDQSNEEIIWASYDEENKDKEFDID